MKETAWEHAHSFHGRMDRVAEIISHIRSPRFMFDLAAENAHDVADRMLAEAEGAIKEAREALVAHGKARQESEAA